MLSNFLQEKECWIPGFEHPTLSACRVYAKHMVIIGRTAWLQQNEVINCVLGGVCKNNISSWKRTSSSAATLLSQANDVTFLGSLTIKWGQSNRLFFFFLIDVSELQLWNFEKQYPLGIHLKAGIKKHWSFIEKTIQKLSSHSHCGIVLWSPQSRSGFNLK